MVVIILLPPPTCSQPLLGHVTIMHCQVCSWMLLFLCSRNTGYELPGISLPYYRSQFFCLVSLPFWLPALCPHSSDEGCHQPLHMKKMIRSNEPPEDITFTLPKWGCAGIRALSLVHLCPTFNGILFNWLIAFKTCIFSSEWQVTNCDLLRANFLQTLEDA